MAAVITQAPIALHNPFCALETEFCHGPNTVQAQGRSQSNAQDNDHNEEGELDLSSWCMVHSDEDSDDDHDDSGDIYLWQQPSMDSYGPLKLSNTTDGFTDISRAAATHSTNSASAKALEQRGAWVVKVSKNKKQSTAKGSTMKSTQQHSSESEQQDDDDDDDEELYMYMTGHELSKSTKATKIKNSRLATLHDHELAKALGCLSQPSNFGDPTTAFAEAVIKRLDRKAIRSRTMGKKVVKSMTKPNNNNSISNHHNDRDDDLGDY
ncbi:hypothetical protein BGX31_010624 [Mortierella sp. GBA43]|nr:hypothetical protein BGX31_010624 [Mortierella sp. GBA43]